MNFNKIRRYCNTLKGNGYVYGDEKNIGVWMLGMAAGVFGIIFIGGYTRLTNSGLSITSFLPLLPLTNSSW